MCCRGIAEILGIGSNAMGSLLSFLGSGGVACCERLIAIAHCLERPMDYPEPAVLAEGAARKAGVVVTHFPPPRMMPAVFQFPPRPVAPDSREPASPQCPGPPG